MCASHRDTAEAQSATGPPDCSCSRASLTSVTARATNAVAKPTSAPTIASPETRTTKTAANVEPTYRVSHSYAGSRVNASNAPRTSAVANGCASQTIAITARTASTLRACRSVITVLPCSWTSCDSTIAPALRRRSGHRIVPGSACGDLNCRGSSVVVHRRAARSSASSHCSSSRDFEARFRSRIDSAFFHGVRERAFS